MSAPGSLPDRLKPAEFARAGDALQGSITVISLPRLQAVLATQPATQNGQVDYALRGMLTERGHEAVMLQVQAQLSLPCQRCLEPVAMTLQSQRRIVFVHDAAAHEAAYEAEDTDVVDWVEWLDVAQLVEDEVLLCLPYAPRHEAGACNTAVGSQDEERPSPFAILAKLARGETRN